MISTRNKVILDLRSKGNSFGKIAAALKISRNTVAGVVHRAGDGYVQNRVETPKYGRKFDLVGQKFGRLTVVARTGLDPQLNVMWSCVCDCGGTTVTRTFSLRNGQTKSCGCLHRERVREALQKRYELRRFGSAA